MPPQDSDRIFAKLDKLSDDMSEVKSSIVKLDTRDEEHKQNIARFWAETWPRIEGTLKDHDSRIGTLERVEVGKLDERIAKLEESLSTARGWVAAIATFASLCVSLLIAALSKLHR